MAVLDPAFGRQVFQIDPYRWSLARRHGLQIRIRKPATESFDHHRARLRAQIGSRSCPDADFHACSALPIARGIDRRYETRERRQRIDVEAHWQPVLASQHSRETPGDAGVAVVIDHGTEDVPAL